MEVIVDSEVRLLVFMTQEVALNLNFRVIFLTDVPRCYQCLVSLHKAAVRVLPFTTDRHLLGPLLRPRLRSLVPLQVRIGSDTQAHKRTLRNTLINFTKTSLRRETAQGMFEITCFSS